MDDTVATIVRVCRELTALGIATIADMHFWMSGSSSSAAINKLLGASNTRTAYVKGISRVASALSQFPEASVGLELLNEPPVRKPDSSAIDWPQIQRDLYDSVRKVAPNLPLILAGSGGQLEGLVTLDASHYVRDRNSLFSFHFYDPFLFTHQDVYILRDVEHTGYQLGRLPYPPDPRSRTSIRDTIAADLRNLRSPISAEKLARVLSEADSYMLSGFNRETIFQQFRRVDDWRARENIDPARILVGEFGVAVAGNDPVAGSLRASQLRWIRDVRAATTASGYKSCYWFMPSVERDYDFDSATSSMREDVAAALQYSH